MADTKNILTIETLEKFERLINRDFDNHDINLMVMPGTLQDKHKNCDRIPALRRQFNLIYLLLSGEHDVKLGADNGQLHPNDLVIVPENMLYASDHIKHCKGYCIHFKTEFLQPLLRKSLTEEFPYFQFDTEHIINITNAESKTIQETFRNILHEYENNSSERNELLRNLIYILLLRVRELYMTHVDHKKKNSTRNEQLTLRFKHLVEKKFVEVRTVSAYASMLNISARHLSEVVKKTIGRSPLEVIHHMLLLEAKVLLGSTDKTVSEISHALHFDDQSHFSHFIKNHTGMSPLDLRKQL